MAKKKIKSRLRHQNKKKKKSGLGGVTAQQNKLQQALALHQAGRLPQAETLYRQILAVEPDQPDALHYLGMLAHQVGKSEVGIALINRALSNRPDYAEAYINLGNIFRSQGQLDDAVDSYRRVLTLQPEVADLHYNLGNALRDQGKLEEAIESYRQALVLQPDDAEVYINIGNTFNDQGKPDEAMASFRRALTLRPDYVEAYMNLGNVLKIKGQLDEAIASYRQALILQPENALVHYNLGTSLMAQDKLEEAAASFRKALELQPDYAEAYNNLGNALKGQGRLQEAVASYRQALALIPDYAEVHSNLLFTLNYMADSTQEEIYAESLQWHAEHTQPGQTDTVLYANSLSTDRRLRIGYVSPDFRVHSVAFFIEPVLRAHDKEKVEVFCYANVKKPDEVTQRLQADADHWFPIRGMAHVAVADRIREDGIDILVDLAGHTSNNSLPVFAYKPAPIQVSWLGYPNTTGLQTMDYRLTDAIADPPEENGMLHTEKLIRLKYGFLCYRPAAHAPPVSSLPCQERGYITFGSFNNLTKATSAVMKTWARILHAVPGSRLLLKAKQLADDATRSRFKDIFAKEGIGADRLEMYSRLPRIKDHLDFYSRVDLGLDPFPYNGTTTTCEALWMGVPVVTLLGSRHAGRVGASILHRISLDDLVAASLDEYIELARSLAADQKRLGDLRSGLRGRMLNSVLMNSRQFTRHLEDVFQQIWREYCKKYKKGY